MQLTTVLACTLLSLGVTANPDFVIGDNVQSFTAKDKAEYAKITKAVIDAASSYQASVTAKPEWTSMWEALKEYQKTGKDVPEGVTATDRILTFSTTPSWYNAMPTDLKNYLDKSQEEQKELIASVLKKATGGSTGDAARPISVGFYLSGALAALVGAVAMAL
ncbi:hypothetical protein G6514_004424 [Epicoccum nigrum]|nr:hypothetical protein G6514_004424 [Epicoccum nigrum]